MPLLRLPFEKEIYEMEDLLAKLEADADGRLSHSEEIRRMRRVLVSLKKKIYSNLTPWQIIQVSRHPDRPMTTDYIDLIFEDFAELHGDRAIGDDRSLRCGLARLGDLAPAKFHNRIRSTHDPATQCPSAASQGSNGSGEKR